MLADNERSRRPSDLFFVEWLVGGPVLQQGITVNTGLMLEDSASANWFGLGNRAAGSFRHQRADAIELPCIHPAVDGKNLAQRHHNLLYRRIAGALPQSVDCAADTVCASPDSRDRVARSHAQIVMTVKLQIEALSHTATETAKALPRRVWIPDTHGVRDSDPAGSGGHCQNCDLLHERYSGA